MVHISQIHSGHRLQHPSDKLEHGQTVKVKVISFSGQRIGLSIKDVDQTTGEDLAPSIAEKVASSDLMSNYGRVSVMDESDIKASRSLKRLSSPERFELKQLMAAGVLDPSEVPALEDDFAAGFNDSNDKIYAIQENEEDIDVELVEEEPAFLRGQTRQTLQLSPVKIVKVPDGTLNRAALQGAALAKERREIRQQESAAEADSKIHDLSSAWSDPMADPSSRYFAQDLKGGRLGKREDMPEWKKSTFSKSTTFGRITSLSIKEQRESLPIFRLRAELVQAIREVILIYWLIARINC